MNGVKRLLEGAGLRTPSPPTPINTNVEPLSSISALISNNKPSWPPSPLIESAHRPDFAKPPQSASSSRSSGSKGSIKPSSLNDDFSTTPGSSYSKPSSPQNGFVAPPTSAELSETNLKEQNHLMDIQDELHMTLLASQAIVDSKDAQILTTEEVEALKKDFRVLKNKQESLIKKLSLETKIRDAAALLSKVNKSQTSPKKSSEQSDVAQNKVEITQRDLWRVSERVNALERRLLEHRAGVLSVSLQNLESKISSESTDDSTTQSFRALSQSPLSSVTSISSSPQTKFDGPHFFAGHAKAVAINPQRARLSLAEFSATEAKLKASTEKMDALTNQLADTEGILARLREEKEYAERSLRSQLSAADERLTKFQNDLKAFNDVEAELKNLRREKTSWNTAYAELSEKQSEIEELKRQMEELKMNSGDSLGFEDMFSRALEESQLEMQEKDAEIERLKELARTEMPDEELSSLRRLMKSQGFSEDLDNMSLRSLLSSIETHISNLSNETIALRQSREQEVALRLKSEENLRSSSERNEEIKRQLEETRQERDALRELARQSDIPQPQLTFPAPDVDIRQWTNLLLPLWQALPSPEARASRLVVKKQSPAASPRSPISPQKSSPSLSDADVKNLRTLYDGRSAASNAEPSPISTFTIEAFTSRVQALIADDRALIERLIRFAQAHELLRRNAERAQKLAQDSSFALETYQKQVKELEDRNTEFAASHADLQEELQRMEIFVKKLVQEKAELDKRGPQGVVAQGLDDRDSDHPAFDAIREKYEAQLAQCKEELERMQTGIESMRETEQTQRIALLDELNSVQTDNANLRAQLRAVKK